MPRSRFSRIIAPTLCLLALLPRLATAQTPPDVVPPPDAVPPPAILPTDAPLSSAPVAPASTPEANAMEGAGRGGGGGFSPFMSATVGNAQYRADYRVVWFPDEPVKNQPTNLGYVQQDIGVTVPFWQDCANEVTGHLNARSEIFHTEAVLPDTGQRFPEELWNIRAGVTYRHLFDNGWIAGVTGSFGSASDDPFHSIHELTVGVNGFLRIPQGDNNAWLFTLSYSPTSELPFPIPGVAFVWHPSEYFMANIGLPFMLLYRPTDDLTLDLSYMLLTTVHARADYRIARPLHVYVGFDWSNESYYPVDRSDDRDRLFYYDKRLTGGVRYLFNPHWSVDLSGGYVFDRFYFEGQSYSDHNQNRIDVGTGPFMALQVVARW
jgi:hypothetical protein